MPSAHQTTFSPRGLWRAALVAAVVGAWPGAALAQFDNSPFGSYFVATLNSNISNQLANLSREQLGEQLVNGKADKRPLSPKDRARQARFYEPDPAARAKLVARIAAAVRVKDPAGANQLLALNAQRDIIREAKNKISRRYAINTFDVAGAFAVNWVYAWLISQGEAGDPNGATMRAVYSQTKAAFDGTSSLAKLNNTQKLEMAETLLLQTVFFSSLLEGAAGRPAEVAQARQIVLAQASAAGLDLATMTLTSRGFVPAKK